MYDGDADCFVCVSIFPSFLFGVRTCAFVLYSETPAAVVVTGPVPWLAMLSGLCAQHGDVWFIPVGYQERLAELPQPHDYQPRPHTAVCTQLLCAHCAQVLRPNKD